MTYKVGALILKDDCLLLSMKSNILGTLYDFPMWTFTPGQIPIETINKKVKTLGLKSDDKAYMGMFKQKNMNVYLYIIKNWCGTIQSKKYVWVHKSVLLCNKKSIPFGSEVINEIF